MITVAFGLPQIVIVLLVFYRCVMLLDKLGSSPKKGKDVLFGDQ